MTVTDLAAVLSVGGTPVTRLKSVRRNASLVRIGQSFVGTLTSSGAVLALQPSDTVTITEAGTLVLTGYLDKIRYARGPEPTVVLEGRDKFKLAEDYFIDDSTLRTHGETVAYWVGYFCGLCGLSYTFSDSGSTLPVGEDVPVGLVTVAEALKSLCQGPGFNMRVTAAGVLEFFKVALRGTATEIYTALQSGERAVGDAATRNVAKIWGAPSDTGELLLYQRRIAIPGIIPDRIMAVGSPNITTLAQAEGLATVLLDHFANLDEVTSFVTAGDPARVIGQIGEATLEPGHTQRSPMTDLESVTDESGYLQAIAIGRKNFFLPYFPPVVFPEWEAAIVYGQALDVCIYGPYIYSAGWSRLGNVVGGRRCWRIEKRLARDGSLIWATTTDYCLTNPGSLGPTSVVEIRGIFVTAEGVFVTGVVIPDGLSPSVGRYWQVEKRNPGDGSVIWSDRLTASSSEGYDIVANATQIIACGFEIAGGIGNGNLAVYNQAGTRTYHNDLPVSSQGWVPFVYSLDLDDTGFLAGGRYRYTTLSTDWMYLAYYDLSYVRQLDYHQAHDGTDSAAYAVAVSIEPAVGALPRAFYRSSELTVLEGGIVKHDAAFTKIWNNRDFNFTVIFARMHIEAVGSHLFQTIGILHWYSKTTGTLVGSRTLSSGSLYGVKLYDYTAQLALCGEQSSLFWTGLWNRG